MAPVATNLVSGNIINDYGLDNVFYTVSTTGLTTSLCAFIGWDLAQSTVATSGKGPAVNVTDSAGNLWRQVGITPVTGTSRCAVWFCDNPRQVSWISVSLTGWAFSTSYTIAEIDNMPSGFQAVSIDFVQTAHSDTAVTSLTVPGGTVSISDICFGILSTGGAGGALTVPSGWTGLAAAGGAFSNQATTYSMYIPIRGAGGVTFIPTWTTAQPASGAIIGLSLSASAPAQPNPNFPAIQVEAAFGADPGDWTQSVDYTWDIGGLTWTDISSRVIGDGTQGKIKVSRGRQYELSQEEAGEIQITLDNHDGAFTYKNAASPYYPFCVPGVPIRVTAWFKGVQYPVAFGYVERWPQEWPELPQWGFSTVIAVDAYGPLAATTLPSAVEGEIRKDSPYAYFPTDEQYSFTTQSLEPIKGSIDANGLIAVNKAFGNSRYGAYRDGFDQPITTGQALNLLGDQDTVMGAATYVAPEANANGPGMFYFDPNIPVNSSGSGVTFEFWFTWGSGTLAANTFFSAWGPPSSFYGSSLTSGGVITVGVNTGNNSTHATGFFVNGTEIASSNPTWNQTNFGPQHFILTSGPVYPLSSQTNTTYLNDRSFGLPNASIPALNSIRALTLGPARFSYDVSDLVVYSGYNFTAGHLAVYPYELTPQQINNHYVAGVFGAGYIPAPGRFAQMLTWGLLGLKRGGTAWFGSYGNSENTFMSEAYNFEGTTGADVMSQVTQTEGGRCYTQGNGSLVYVMRWSRYNGTSRATFGDAVVTYESLTAAEGPAAWWKLSDPPGSPAALDSSGNGHTGTPVNVTFGAYAGSGPVSAASFNGTNSGITTGYNPSGFSAFTVEAWVYVRTPTGNPRVIANSHTDIDKNGFELFVSGGTAPTFAVGNGASNTFLAASSAITQNAWHYLAATVNGTAVTLYVDGASAGTGTFSGTVSAGVNSIALGYGPYGSYPANITGSAVPGSMIPGSSVPGTPLSNNDYTNGMIAEAAFYTSALSGAQIAAKYAAASNLAWTAELPFQQDSAFSVDNSFIYNTVSATQNRGPDQTFYVQQNDAGSQQDYFSRSGLQLQSYALTPFDVNDVVNWSLAKYKQPSQRVQQLSLNPATEQAASPAMFPAILSLELTNTVTVNRRPVGGAAISVTGSIQQIQHDIGPTVWSTKYQIAPVAPENQALIADVSGQNTPGTQALSW